MAQPIHALPLRPLPPGPADPGSISAGNGHQRPGRHAASRFPALRHHGHRSPDPGASASDGRSAGGHGEAARHQLPATIAPDPPPRRDALAVAVDWLAELRAEASRPEASEPSGAVPNGAVPNGTQPGSGASGSVQPVTERALIGDELRLPIVWCGMDSCIAHYEDPEALGEADVRVRAIERGWRFDALGRLACPECQQRSPCYWSPYPVSVWDRGTAIRTAAELAARLHGDAGSRGGQLAGPAPPGPASPGTASPPLSPSRTWQR